MNNKRRPAQILVSAIGSLAMATGAMAGPSHQNKSTTQYSSSHLTGIRNFKKCFRENDVTIIGDTDHRDAALQRYYSDPRFLDAAEQSEIKGIVLEINAELQPSINALANGKITKTQFVKTAVKKESLNYADPVKYFSALADMVVSAKQRGIQVVAGDTIVYPRTPEILKLIDAYRSYVQRVSPEDYLQSFGNDQPPYRQFNPGGMRKFGEFVEAHKAEFDVMENQRIDYRQSVAGNLPSVINAAKAFQGKEDITVSELKQAYKHTIIIFGAAHASAIQSLLKQVELSSGVINFESTVADYGLHQASLSRENFARQDGRYVKTGGDNYPSTAAFILEDNKFVPGRRLTAGVPPKSPGMM
jgi:hypothetical protein